MPYNLSIKLLLDNNNYTIKVFTRQIIISGFNLAHENSYNIKNITTILEFISNEFQKINLKMSFDYDTIKFCVVLSTYSLDDKLSQDVMTKLEENNDVVSFNNLKSVRFNNCKILLNNKNAKIIVFGHATKSIKDYDALLDQDIKFLNNLFNTSNFNNVKNLLVKNLSETLKNAPLFGQNSNTVSILSNEYCPSFTNNFVVDI